MQNFKKMAFLLPALWLSTGVWAQQKLLPQGSEMLFVSKQMGVPVEGRFQKFDAQLRFDPQRPEASQVRLTVDMASATLGVKEVDAELPKPVWFGVAKFPQASFESTAIQRVKPGQYEVKGKLSIKGATQELTVPVTFSQADASTTAVGSFVIKRLSFKIGDNEWADTSMVADEVQIKFKLNLSGMPKI